MKVSEKIYRTTTYLDSDRGKTLWKEKPVAGAENIEYTRTDAFIEKAKKWIKDNGYMYNGEYEGDVEALAEDFVNYMKGE